MKLKAVALALALCTAGPAMAADCTSTYSLGTLGANGFRYFDHFFGAGPFNDCYNFTLGVDPASATTAVLKSDWSSHLNLDFTSVSLSGGNVQDYATSSIGQIWTFGNLVAGDYQLAVAGNVYETGATGLEFGIGYVGALVVTPVPEPEMLGMLALGLATVVWGARRKS
jgi:PEP-CTERM motif